MIELVDFSLNEKRNINAFLFAADNVIYKDKIFILCKCNEAY
jgi:uncharacterized protein YydD (DUF2326 family)